MKKITKLFLTITLFLIVVSFSSLIKSHGALSPETLDNYYKETKNIETKIYNTVTWNSITAKTRTDYPLGKVAGYGSTGSIDPNKWYGQQINVLSVPRLESNDGDANYKVVAWSVQDTDSWRFAGPTAIGEDYERTHPDYIVLGGINADFYDWHTTYDYPNSGIGMEIRDGDIVRAVLTSWGAVGVKNDLSNHQLVYSMPTDDSVLSTAFVLQILDENNQVVNEFDIPNINAEGIGLNETTALFGHNEIIYNYEVETYLDELGEAHTKVDEYGNPVYKVDEHGEKIHLIDSNGEYSIKERIYHEPLIPAEASLFVVEDAELVIYQYEDGDSSCFGKGIITSTSKDSIGKHDFAISTKDPNVIEALSGDNVKIRVQRKLLGDFVGIENATGAYLPLVQNGVYNEMYLDNDYFTTRAPRTLIGCKDDGTITLITMEGRQPQLDYYGTNQEEINSVLIKLGVTDAFLLDGGGSTAFFVRENNKLVVKNSPSDGKQRSVANAFLVVAKKDSSVEISNCTPSANALEFDVDINDADNVKEAYVCINDQLYKAEDGKVKVDKLQSGTMYDVTLYYKNNQDSLIQTTNVSSYYTNKVKPVLTMNEFVVDDQYVYPSLKLEDPDGALKMVMVESDDDFLFYSFDEGAENKIKRPKGEEFSLSITFTYQLNPQGSMEEEMLTYNYKKDEVKPTEDPTQPSKPTDETGKKSCKSCSSCRKSSAIALSLISLMSISLFIIKRKK